MLNEKIYIPLDVAGELTLTTEQIASERVAVLGATGSGKSNCIAVLLEQMLPDIPFLIVDTHGEYGSLRGKFNIPIVGTDADADVAAEPEDMAALARYSFENRASLILNLLLVDGEKRIDYVHNFLTTLFDLSKRMSASERRFYGVVLEEAQNFIPEGRVKSPSLAKMKEIALEGRKFGLSIIIASQRASEMSKTVLGQCALVFLHGAYIYADFQQYQGMLPYTLAETKDIALGLETGEAIVRYKKRVGVYQMRKSDYADLGATPTLGEGGGMVAGELVKDLKSLISERAIQTDLGFAGDSEKLKLEHMRIENERLHGLLDERTQENKTLADQLAKMTTERGEMLEKIGRLEMTLTQANDMHKRITVAPVADQKPAVNGSDAYRSPLQTTRGLHKQERAFVGLLADCRTAPGHQGRILHWLTIREGERFDLKTICRYLGLATNTVYNQPPLIFVQRGMLGRSGRGKSAIYWSRISEYLKREFPDLDGGEVMERFLKNLPRL